MATVSLAEMIRNAKPGSGDYAIIPVSVYDAVVESAEYKKSTGGHPGPNITFLIAEPGEYEGRKVWCHIMISEKSVNFAVERLAVLGVSQEDLANAVTNDNWLEVCQKLVDATCRISIEHNKGTGDNANKVYANVKKILPATGASTAGVGPLGGVAVPASAKPTNPF